MQKIDETTGKAKYVLSAFTAAALWGFMSISLREIQAWPSEDILYYRILVSVVLIWVFIGLFRRRQWRTDRLYIRSLGNSSKKRLLGLILLASLFIMGNWFTFIYAVNRISVQSAAFAYMVCPLLTTLGAYWILREELSLLKKIGLGIALLSVLLLAQGSLTEVVWSVVVALMYALYLIVQRMIQHVDKLNVLAVQITICTLLIVPVLLFQGHAMPVEDKFWTHITLIAVLFTIVPLYLSMYALNGISSSTTGILLYINPILAFLVAIFYFHEPVSMTKVLSYSILLVAVVLFNWELIRELIRDSRKQQAEAIRSDAAGKQ